MEVLIVKKIMFVCTGNICRSAMADFLFRKKLENLDLLNNVHVCSAGTYAYPGDIPTYDGIKVMKNIYDIVSYLLKRTILRNHLSCCSRILYYLYLI